MPPGIAGNIKKFLVVTSEGVQHLVGESKDASIHPTVHIITLHSKELSSPNVNSAKVEKLLFSILIIYVFRYSFIQYLFIEHLPCSTHCTANDKVANKITKVPTLVQFALV